MLPASQHYVSESERGGDGGNADGHWGIDFVASDGSCAAESTRQIRGRRHGGQRLVEYTNASGAAANTMDVVYLDNYETAQNDVQGRAYRTNDPTLTPNRPIVTITLNPPAGGAATYPTTLAHELGHAITGCPAHIQDANNLMSAGSMRNGTNRLSDGQVAWLRNSPWAH